MDWITYIKEDEDRALKDIYTLYRSSCISWLQTNYKISQEDAKEIFQDSIIILYDNVVLGKLKELSSGIKSYLYSIAKNKAREWLRRKSKTSILNNINSVSNENGVKEKKILEIKFNHLDAVILSIGDPCKTLLQLYYYKRFSMSKICEIMGYKNRDTVKNQKYKCIKRLQKLIKDHKQIEDQYEA